MDMTLGTSMDMNMTTGISNFFKFNVQYSAEIIRLKVLLHTPNPVTSGHILPKFVNFIHVK